MVSQSNGSSSNMTQLHLYFSKNRKQASKQEWNFFLPILSGLAFDYSSIAHSSVICFDYQSSEIFLQIYPEEKSQTSECNIIKNKNWTLKWLFCGKCRIVIWSTHFALITLCNKNCKSNFIVFVIFLHAILQVSKHKNGCQISHFIYTFKLI